MARQLRGSFRQSLASVVPASLESRDSIASEEFNSQQAHLDYTDTRSHVHKQTGTPPIVQWSHTTIIRGYAVGRVTSAPDI